MKNVETLQRENYKLRSDLELALRLIRKVNSSLHDGGSIWPLSSIHTEVSDYIEMKDQERLPCTKDTLPSLVQKQDAS